MTVAIDIELYTDPACPFAFSAEPIRQRLRWHYGEGLRWRTTMIVLTLEPGEDEKLQAGAPVNEQRTALFYGGGAEGYTDHPRLSA